MHPAKETSASSDVSRGERPLYFVNGWVDAAAIGGLSILAFIFLRLFWGSEPATPAVRTTATVLSFFINYPHFSATIYRLYQDKANIRQFPVTSLVVPVVITCAVLASLWQPAIVAPWFVTLYLFWSPYHYSGQTLGISALYARRSGFRLGQVERAAISGFVLSTFLVSFARAQNNAATPSFLDIPLSMFRFPEWFIAAGVMVMIASAAIFLVLIAHWSREHRRLPPVIILLPAATQFIWFMPTHKGMPFLEFVPLFHSLQYLYIAWVVQMGRRLDRPGQRPHRRAIAVETLKWLLANCAGGIVLFLLSPLLFFWSDAPSGTITAILITAVNVHHFFVDGVIWRLREVSERSPLMMNIRQFGRAAQNP
jgi:hypothetical protein